MAGGSHQGGGNYLHATKGKFKGTIAGTAVEYDFYEGKIIGLQKFTDTFENQPIDKWKLVMQDGEEKVMIDFKDESWFYLSFFQRLLNVKLGEPLVVGISKSDQNDKISFCWMKQHGAKIEADKNTFINPPKKTFGKQTVTDWTATTSAIEGFVKEHFGEQAIIAVPKDQSNKIVAGQEDGLPF